MAERKIIEVTPCTEIIVYALDYQNPVYLNREPVRFDGITIPPEWVGNREPDELAKGLE